MSKKKTAAMQTGELSEDAGRKFHTASKRFIKIVLLNAKSVFYGHSLKERIQKQFLILVL